MKAIIPYLGFAGKCQEAMKFYQSCLGGELDVMMVKDSPNAGEVPEEMKNGVMHAALTNGDVVIYASDMMTEEALQHNSIVTLNLNCSSETEINELFDKLSSGGTVHSPVKLEFWGDMFGQFTDKYGVNWMLTYTPNAK